MVVRPWGIVRWTQCLQATSIENTRRVPLLVMTHEGTGRNRMPLVCHRLLTSMTCRRSAFECYLRVEPVDTLNPRTSTAGQPPPLSQPISYTLLPFSREELWCILHITCSITQRTLTPSADLETTVSCWDRIFLSPSRRWSVVSLANLLIIRSPSLE